MRCISFWQPFGIWSSQEEFAKWDAFPTGNSNTHNEMCYIIPESYTILWCRINSDWKICQVKFMLAQPTTSKGRSLPTIRDTVLFQFVGYCCFTVHVHHVHARKSGRQQAETLIISIIIISECFITYTRQRSLQPSCKILFLNCDIMQMCNIPAIYSNEMEDTKDTNSEQILDCYSAVSWSVVQVCYQQSPHSISRQGYSPKGTY